MSGRPAGRPLDAVWAAAVVGSLALVLFGHLFFASRSLYYRDFAVFHLPYKWMVREAWRAGELPLWNPAIHAGQPMLSNPNYGVLYPPSLLFVALPFLAGMKSYVVAHFLLAGMGAWWMARRLGFSLAAALFAAVAYCAGGVMLSLVNTLNFFAAAAWIPWSVAGTLGVVRAWRSRSPVAGNLFLAAATLALQLYAGEPVAALAGALAVGVFAVAETWDVRRGGFQTRPCVAAWQNLRRGIGAALAIGALALALAAPQLLPSWEHMRGARRWNSLDPRIANSWSMHPVRLAELAVAGALGNPLLAEERGYWGRRFNTGGIPYVLSLYPGALVFLGAVVAFVAGSRRAVPALALVLLGILLAMGNETPVYGWLRAIPVVRSIRYPEKFIVLAHLGLVIAAAGLISELGARRLRAAAGLISELGARRRQTADAGRRLWIPAAAVAGLALAAAIALAAARPAAIAFMARSWDSRWDPVVSPALIEAAYRALRHDVFLSALELAIAAALLAALAAHRLRPALAAVLPTLFLAGDLAATHGGLNPTVPDSFYRDPPVALAELPPAASRYRVLQRPQRLAQGTDYQVFLGFGRDRAALHKESLRPFIGGLWGISYGLNSDFDETLTASARQQEELESWSRKRGRGGWERCLGLHNVLFEIRYRDAKDQFEDPRGAYALRLNLRPGSPPVAPPVALQRLADFLPRYRFTPEVRSAATWGPLYLDVAARREDFANTSYVLAAAGRDGPLAAGRVTRAREAVNRIDIDVETAGTAFLALSQTWDTAWEARIDGAKPVAIERANFGLAGIFVPPGRHRLVLRCRAPRTLWWGIALACLGITVAAVVAAMAARELPVAEIAAREEARR